MLCFKEKMLNDFNNVLFNTNELAENVRIYYGKEWHKVRAIIESDVLTDRKNAKDNVPDSVLYNCGIKLHLLKSELKFSPRKGNEIRVNDEVYSIVNVKNEPCTFVLELLTSNS